MATPAPEYVSSLEESQRFLKEVHRVIEQMPVLVSQLVDFWNESAALLSKGSDTQGHPMRRSEFLLLEVTQTQFMGRIQSLLKIGPEIVAHATAMDFQRKYDRYFQAVKAMDIEAFEAVFDLKALEVLRADQAIINIYLRKSLLATATAIIAAYMAAFDARDIFAAFLRKPPSSRTVIDFFVEATGDVALGELAKAIPGFGSVVVLAKVLHRRAEGREEDFEKGFTERDYVLDLEDAVQDKNGFLAAAEQATANYHQYVQSLDEEFDEAIDRATKMLDIVRADSFKK